MALNTAQLMAVPGGPGIVGAVQAGTGIAISGTGVISAVTYSGPTAPPGPSIGTLWYDTAAGLIKFWNGTAWVPITSDTSTLAGQGLAAANTALKVKITTNNAPPAPNALPAGAIAGSLYWDNNLGELFIYYFDGATTQWVQTNYGSSGGGGSGSVPSVSVVGINGIQTTGSPILTAGTISVDFPIQNLTALP